MSQLSENDSGSDSQLRRSSERPKVAGHLRPRASRRSRGQGKGGVGKATAIDWSQK